MCQAAAIAVVIALDSVRFNEGDRIERSGMGLVRQYVPSTRKPSSRVIKTSARQTKSSLLTCSVSGGWRKTHYHTLQITKRLTFK